MAVHAFNYILNYINSLKSRGVMNTPTPSRLRSSESAELPGFSTIWYAETKAALGAEREVKPGRWS